MSETVIKVDARDQRWNELGLKCPRCPNRGRFRIIVSVGRITTAEGSFEEDPMNMDEIWDESSDCECAYCHHSGTVSDFRENLLTYGGSHE